MKKNILVFPCGSEIALEVYRSLKHSIHFNLIGASSVSDHGKFVYENYIPGVPYVNDNDFISAIKKIVDENHIEYIYPAMDSVIYKLKKNEKELGCTVIASPNETTAICLSKEKTYEILKGIVPIPQVFNHDSVPQYPVFCKPKIGYGSRGAKKISDRNMLDQHLSEYPDSLILEYLPGEEYTVDCFTDKNRKLLFCGARVRRRIANGISVNTVTIADGKEFRMIADKINNKLEMRGAWFVQLKRNMHGQLTLMEIASRLGGSSGLYRACGINFAQMSLFDAMEFPVMVVDNKFHVEMDRALDNQYKMDIQYNEVFIDYDDTIIINGCDYNTDAMKFLYKCKNRKIKLTLLSSHDGDLEKCLDQFGLKNIFDRVIHIKKSDNKGNYIDNMNSIFVDDSFAERKRVFEKTGIPVFGVDMIPNL